MEGYITLVKAIPLRGSFSKPADKAQYLSRFLQSNAHAYARQVLPVLGEPCVLLSLTISAGDSAYLLDQDALRIIQQIGELAEQLADTLEPPQTKSDQGQ